jgi:diguanylate cyclase (GGDEF)-like protein
MKNKILKHPFLLPVIISLVLYAIFAAFIFSRTPLLIQEKYTSTAIEIQRQIQTLISEKHEALLLVALTKGIGNNIKQALLYNRPEELELDSLAVLLRDHSPLDHAWFQIIKPNGESFYRSWTDKKGDSLLTARLDVVQMISDPKVMTSISTGKYNLTFKVMVPIYDRGEFIAIFEIISNFNSIAEKLTRQGTDPVILVDRSYRAQLTKAFTERFVDDYYVANQNVNTKYLKFIAANNIERFVHPAGTHLIFEQQNLFVSFYELPDIYDQSMAHFILFKPLDSIDLSEIYAIKYRLLVYLAAFIGLIILSLHYLSKKRLTQHISEVNYQLEDKVANKTKELQEQSQFLQSIVDGVSDLVMVIDKEYNVIMVNDQAKKFYPDDRQNESGLIKCYQLSHGIDSPCRDPVFECPHSKVFASGEVTRVTHSHIDKEGYPQFIELTVTPLKDDEGNITAIIESGHNITPHIMIQDQLLKQNNDLDYQVHHDVLTQLPNRILFHDRLRHAIKLAHRSRKKIAILFIDLDRFKAINDNFGHSAGDEMLRQVAKRLTKQVREGDTVARVGGDEFIIILESIIHANDIVELTRKLLLAIKQPVKYTTSELTITASIGISLYPDNGSSPDMLINNADLVMYLVKEKGGNQYQFYTSQNR